MNKVLVTGGCGFIGSNFINHLIFEGDYEIRNLDSLTYAGNLENLTELKGYKNYKLNRGDICDSELVDFIFDKFEPNYVVNFAAESHVDRSIENPEDFIRTNVEGTRVLLGAALNNFELKKGFEKFIQIGTDEVYGSLDKDSPSSKETDTLDPSSPYSASKASADHLARSYFKTYGLPVCITRSSNNFGPKQNKEKFMPLIITNLIEGEKIPVYGEGENIRDWLYVGDNCIAIEEVMNNGKPGEIYNIGGGNELRNIDLTKKILKKMNCDESMIKFVKDRKGHDKIYSLDCSKIENELGWFPILPFERGLNLTIDWYKRNENWWKRLKD